MPEIIKTDKTDLRIITAIEADARIPISELARNTRSSRSVVEYRLQKLGKEGVIRGFYCLLDPSRFGLTVWKLWISLHSSAADEKEKLHSHLNTHPRVWWYARCAGVYDLVTCILARSPHDFNDFFNELHERFGPLVADTAILINVSFEYHTRGYLLSRPSSLIESSFQRRPVQVKLTDDDIDILRILSKDSRTGLVDISSQTKRNVKTIKKTMKQLKDSGVIVYYRPSIDTTRLGYEFYKVLLRLHNPRGGIIPSVVSWCRQQRNVVAVISCVGPWQIELEVEVGAFRQLCDIMTQMKDEFPDLIKSYDTLLVTGEGNHELDLASRIRQIS